MAAAVKVVDASAVAALLFREDHADDIDEQLTGAMLAAPALLPFEVTNICRTKLRQYPGQRDVLLAQFALRDDLLIAAHAVDQAEILELAERFGLTAYDASYLWLARELNAELVTLDRRLAHAAAELR